MQVLILNWLNEFRSEYKCDISRKFDVYFNLRCKRFIPTGCHSGIEYRRAHKDDQHPTNQSTKEVGKTRYNLKRTRISVKPRSHNHFAPMDQGSNGPHLSGNPRCGFRVARVTFFAPRVMAASCAISIEEGPPPTMRISFEGRSSADRISQLCLIGKVAVSDPSNFGIKGRFSRPEINKFLHRDQEYLRKQEQHEHIVELYFLQHVSRHQDIHTFQRYKHQFETTKVSEV